MIYKKKLLIVAFFACFTSESLFSSDLREVFGSFPYLARALAQGKDQFLSEIRSLEPGVLFEEIKNLKKWQAALNVVPEDQKKAMHKKYADLYEIVFDKAGGDTELDKHATIDNANVPLLVKAAFNQAVNLYNTDEIDQAYRIFKKLESKGYTPAIKAAGECNNERKELFQKAKSAHQASAQAIQSLTGKLGEFVETITRPENMAGILQSIFKKVALEMSENNLSLPEEVRAELATIEPKKRTAEFEQLTQNIQEAMKSTYGDGLRAQVLENFRRHVQDPTQELQNLANMGDLKGLGDEITKIKHSLADTTNPVQEIAPEDLFQANVLDELRAISDSIYQAITPDDAIFFVGRSPLYISRMLQSLYPKARVFEVPFSYKGSDIDLLSKEDQKKYAEAEAHFGDFLRRAYGQKVAPGGKIYAIDRYESGGSINKFCDLLEQALGINPQIIALRNSEDAVTDPRLVLKIQLTHDCVMKMRANDDVKGLDASLGMPFSWGEWHNWQNIMARKPAVGAITQARLDQMQRYLGNAK